jgi:hypothetical protein
VALVTLDAKTVDFSINGMETGFLIFLLAPAHHEGRRRVRGSQPSTGEPLG